MWFTGSCLNFYLVKESASEQDFTYSKISEINEGNVQSVTKRLL